MEWSGPDRKGLSVSIEKYVGGYLQRAAQERKGMEGKGLDPTGMEKGQVVETCPFFEVEKLLHS